MSRWLLPPCLVLAAIAGVGAAPRLLLLDGEGGMTARALQALNVPCTVGAPGDYASGKLSPFDFQIVVAGMDVDRASLGASPERLLAFVRTGGVFLGMRASQEDTWLPTPVKMDKAYELGEIIKPEHPLFSQPTKFTKPELNKVHGGSIYRAFYDLGEGWVPLVGTGREQSWDKTPAASAGPHYGIIELAYGRGRIILCQMIPDYGFVNDDKGQPGLSSQFVQNLLTYTTSLAPNWPAPKPRVVPASFHASLGDVLREPTAAGTLPMADGAWQVTSQGAYACKPDRRGVVTVSAADRPAVAGSFLQLERTVQIAPGRAFLRFYNSDDYCGGMDPHMVGDRRESQRENRIKDTRFKQVLVNGKVVWEQDALGLNERPASQRFHLVDITEAAGSKGSFTLALRVEDRKSTAEDEPFATDVYWAGVDVLPGITQVPVAEKQTSVKTAFSGAKGRYAVLVRALDEHTGRGKLTVAADGKALGSVQLTADDYGWYWISFGQADLRPGSTVTLKATPDAGESCTMHSLAFVPVSLLGPRASSPRTPLPSSPLFKPGPAVTRATFPLLVSGPEAYKPQGEVVSGGMPFAYGAVKSEQSIRLLNDQGREVPLQTRVLAKWPDGSLKWVLFTLPTAPGEVRCEYGTQVKREPQGASMAVESGDTITINTGVLQARLRKRDGAFVQQISLGGKQFGGWRLVMTTEDGKQYASDLAPPTRCEVVEAGPLRTIVRRVGRLQSKDGATLLEYDVLLQFDANSGAIRVQPALTHKESSAEEKIKSVWFEMPVARGDGPAWVQVDGQWLRAREAVVSQIDDQASSTHLVTPDGKEADGPGKRQNGFVRLAGGGVSVDLIPRWFWQMAPKSIAVEPNGLRYTLLSGDPFVLHQGEGIWNDFALRFSDDTREPNTADFDALANPAVALAEPQYIASTLALGQFAPENPTVFPDYEAAAERSYQGYLAKREQRREYGVQNFGDDTFEWGYGPSYTFWSNQEYDHHYGMLLQFLRSGDWRWWEIGDEGARHHVNEDCVHWAPGREYLLGAPHHHNARHIVEKGWFPDHTVSGCDVSHSWVEGQITYYVLTGDMRTFENWNAMGDWYVWCVNNNRYGAGGQERGPGWTLIALSALYNTTHEQKYLDAGSKVMDWLRGIQDSVRGVVSIPVSEQPSYEGGSSFMHGIVARGAGRWYEATGDGRGRLAAVGIADWLTAESMGPPARFYYKQAPRIKGNYGSDWQCLTAMTYGMKYGDPAWYGPLAETLYDSGRPDTRSMAWVPQSLAHLQGRFSPYRARLLTPSVKASPAEPGEVRLHLQNTTGEPVTVGVTTIAAPAGLAIGLPAPVTLAPQGQSDVSVSVAVRDLPRASGVVKLGLKAGTTERQYEVAVAAMAQIVRIEKTAAEGQLQAPFVLDRDKAATAPRDASFTGNPRQPGERVGWIAWGIDVPVAGSYMLSADCWWLDDKGNSLFLQVDDGPEVVFGNDGEMGRWHVVRAGEALRLTAGRHVIRLVNREDGAKVRRLTIEAEALR
ncbi:hypothetical protein LLH23_14865 [bacterium]|nr:hypothetical protein [bacterium]